MSKHGKWKTESGIPKNGKLEKSNLSFDWFWLGLELRYKRCRRKSCRRNVFRSLELEVDSRLFFYLKKALNWFWSKIRINAYIENESKKTDFIYESRVWCIFTCLTLCCDIIIRTVSNSVTQVLTFFSWFELWSSIQ